ncbi:AI-2E family transporter [Eubacteriales bacterium OttesenSCG-928-M02]|nr:AI-2E family transporter [Eubacteriales bacterium OttesenSCG-928-M02]
MEPAPSTKKYIKYALFIGATLILFYFFLLRFSAVWAVISKLFSVLAPFFLGIALAFLLHRPMRAIEVQLMRMPFFQTKHDRLRRTIAMVLVYCMVGAGLTLLVTFIVPEIIDSITAITQKLPGYMQQLDGMLTWLMGKLDIPSEDIAQLSLSWETIVQAVIDYFGNVAGAIMGTVMQVTVITVNFFLGIILSVYLLFSKEKFIRQAKKVLFWILPVKWWEDTTIILRDSNDAFTSFLNSQVLLSLLLGVGMYVVLALFGFPYALLLSVICAVLNIIPYFGPIIGTVLCSLLLLPISPLQALSFVIIATIIQQVEGNVVGPLLMSDKMGLPAFWVMLAVVVGGGFFGIGGMVLGVPVMAVLYAFFSRAINKGLKRKTSIQDLPE